ncbi:MAG: hypothetical protein II551_05150 [Paludibacteraceae bacterium]|nr:hypothetical protein [Paludibacteraceae bacterium]
MKRIYSILLFLPLLLTACQFGREESVDFTKVTGLDSTMFRVIAQHEVDLSDGFPTDCYLPDGTRINDYHDETPATGGNGMRYTSSVTGAAIVQNLLDWGNVKQVIEVVGTYQSLDADYNPITLSGKVMLPAGRRPKRIILVSHYTIGSNAEAPSNAFSLEGVLVRLGYGVVIPDYLGYGVTADKVHPYLVMDITAFNVIDMWLAVRPWLKAVGMEPEQPDIYLMGYSQGGATTMAVLRWIELLYGDSSSADYIPVHRVFAGGGPYDVKSTYERFVNTDVAGYPVAVPLVLQGMIEGYGINMKMEDMMQPWLCEKVDDWINSKRYTTGQINKLINTKVTHELLTEEAMAQTSDKVAELYKAMTDNSIISYNWQPSAPVYLMHSIDDETVPYSNAVNAKNKWRDANIEYNLGHYGSHVRTCLRFIYSVQTLLEEEEEERGQYE